MSALRTILRLSRHDLRRAKGRSLLIFLMIAVPVALVSHLLVLFTTAAVNAEEAIPAELGSRADAQVRSIGYGLPVEQDAFGELWNMVGETAPDSAKRSWTTAQIAAATGGRVSRITEGEQVVEIAGDRKWIYAYEIDSRDPLTQGTYVQVSGRMPANAGEAAVSRALAELAPIGSTLRLPRTDARVRVVGVAESAGNMSPSDAVIMLPGVADPAPESTLVPQPAAGAVPDTTIVRPVREVHWLVDTPAPVGWTEVRRLNQEGLVVRSRSVAADPPELPTLFPRDETSGTEATGVLLGILLIVLEVVLLAGPAFAVGLRRRRRELGLLAAQGAEPGHLRRLLLADGLVLGGLAGLAGVPLGIGIAALTVWRANLPVPVYGPFEVPGWPLAGVAALALASGLLAALTPAIQAGRADVAGVLAGRRDRVRDRAGLPVLGVVLVVAGTACCALGARLRGTPSLWLLAIVFGVLVLLLGLVALTPLLVRVAGRTRARLPLPLRLAARDAARNRGRTAPAVAAVMAAMAGLTTIAVLLSSQDADRRATYVSAQAPGTATVFAEDLAAGRWAGVRSAVEAELPGVPLIEVKTVGSAGDDLPPLESRAQLVRSCQGCGYAISLLGDVVVGGRDLLRYVLGKDDPVAAAALAAGKAVVFDANGVRDGKARISVPGTADKPTRVTVPAVAVRADRPPPVGAILPDGLASDSRLTARTTALLIDPADLRLTAEQERRVGTRVSELSGQVSLEMNRGPQAREGDLTLAVITLVAGLLVLVAAVVATALAAADARPDLDTMAAIGASPWTRRLTVAGQGAFIAGLGTLVGLAAGLVPGSLAAWAVTGAPDGGIRYGADTATIPEFASTPIVDVPWMLLAGTALVLPLLAALITGVFTRAGVRPLRRLT
ncbi:FtsX-like permease family protein [Acrocarpospora sp. B8E8]|uniref:FtsX-like permease family protein n=1 Tax=Acrocarpospora sp. B8E8 TaxID=3153572 RepID=UPI00325DB60A